MYTYRLMAMIVLGAGFVWSQPVIAISGVRNSATFVLQGLPNGDLAQGSIFTVILSSTLPVPDQFLSNYPVPTVFNGASMKVSVGGTSVDVLMFGTAKIPSGGSQLDGILPSSTPLGAGTLTVTYNGQTSAPAPINVVPGSFGWYTATSRGVGPGAFTDLKYQYLTPIHAASPGQVVIGWGTGLGPVSGNEASGGLPGPMNVPNLKMWVGGHQVTPSYTGRANFPGEDQINFQIPAGVTGCAVPVIVQIGNVVSNTATIPVAASGNMCSDPGGFSNADLQNLTTKGSFSLGLFALDGSDITLSPIGLGPTRLIVSDSAAATFSRLSQNSIGTISSPFSWPSLGGCTVAMSVNSSNGNPSTPGTGFTGSLDAGPMINLNGPAGARQIPRNSVGSYAAAFNDVQPYFNPGTYTADNGSGGTDVGPFNASFDISAPLQWANQDSVTAIDRSQGVTVTWTGGDPNSYAIISGSSYIANSTVGASFFCTAPIDAGQFTVPSYVLLALPPSSGFSDPASVLQLGSSGTTRVNLAATGLDAAYVNATRTSGKNVPYR